MFKESISVHFDKLRFLQHNLSCEQRLFGSFRKIIASSVFKNKYSAEALRVLSTEEWPEAVGLDWNEDANCINEERPCVIATDSLSLPPEKLPIVLTL